MFLLKETNKFTGVVKYRSSVEMYGWSEDKSKAIKMRGLSDLCLAAYIDHMPSYEARTSDLKWERESWVFEFIPLHVPARQQIIDFQPT